MIFSGNVPLVKKTSTLFPIAKYSPTIKEQCQSTKRVKKALHIHKRCTFEINHSQRLNKVFQWAGVTYQLHPFGHIPKRGEKSAQIYHRYHEKEHNENCLLNIIGVIGND